MLTMLCNWIRRPKRESSFESKLELILYQNCSKPVDFSIVYVDKDQCIKGTLCLFTLHCWTKQNRNLVVNLGRIASTEWPPAPERLTDGSCRGDCSAINCLHKAQNKTPVSTKFYSEECNLSLFDVPSKLLQVTQWRLVYLDYSNVLTIGGSIAMLLPSRTHVN